MHAAARRWIEAHADPRATGAGVDLGGRDINGQVRTLFPLITWTVVDVEDGPGVDLVADAATYSHPDPVTIVLCTEVLEHTPVWPAVLATARRALDHGGRLLVTAAGPRRKAHSALGGGPPRRGEWYCNIDPDHLSAVLRALRFEGIAVDSTGHDVRAEAFQP